MIGLGAVTRPGHMGAVPRTSIAIIAGLAGFLVYVAIVVALGDAVRGAAWPIEAAYFAIAGFAWTWPALRLIAWAVKDPRRVASTHPE